MEPRLSEVDFADVACARGVVVAVGGAGQVPVACVSRDGGRTFAVVRLSTERFPQPATRVRATADGGWVVVAPGRLFFSPDGGAWEAVRADGIGLVGGDVLPLRRGGFVASDCDYNGRADRATGTLRVSDDGRAWRVAAVVEDAWLGPLCELSSGEVLVASRSFLGRFSRERGWGGLTSVPLTEIQELVADGGRLWAACLNGVFACDDGGDWRRVVAAPSLRVWASGGRVARASATEAASSRDGGATWRALERPDARRLTGLVGLVDGALLVVGAQGLVRRWEP